MMGYGQDNASPGTPKIYTIGEINRMAANLLDSSFPTFWLTGEVGTMNPSRPGHVYMNLKENGAQISAVHFGAASLYQRMQIKIGTKLEAYGKLAIYAPTGSYQFVISQVRLCGTGSLQEQFDALCAKLEAEGLFSPERKRPLPFLPLKIGLVTSAEGAAVRDFIKVAQSRFRGLDIRIYPSAVQGNDAPAQLAEGVRYFNRQGDVDVIVLTRGGGSREDLWCFNDEMLARTIAGSKIPTVSAVGHERDFSISDFVADARAATPTAAAEILCPEKEVLFSTIENLVNRVRRATEFQMIKYKHRLERASASASFSQIRNIINTHRQFIDNVTGRILDAFQKRISDARTRIQAAGNVIRCCSPESVVKRGFVILTKPNDSVPLCTVAQVKTAHEIQAVMSDGTVVLTVQE